MTNSFRILASAILAAIPALATAQETRQTITLWPAGAATLKGASEKEVTRPENPQPGERINSIVNVHNPSLEIHLPPTNRSVGTAVIVAPGGGHRQLV